MNIISFTTIPSRFDRIGPVIAGYLAQSAPIDKVILYIPRRYRRFPDWDGSLPDLPDGLEVRRVDEDLGPASKVLYAVRDFAGRDVNIIFGDDDHVYKRDWAATLLREARQRPGHAITLWGFDIDFQYDIPTPANRLLPRAIPSRKATDFNYRLRRIGQQIDVFNLFTTRIKPSRAKWRVSGYTDIFEGFAGVLVRPEFFDEAAFDIPAGLWAVDDIWLSGHATRNGVPIWGVANAYQRKGTELQKHTALHASIIDGLDRDQANLACIRYFQETYGVWT